MPSWDFQRAVAAVIFDVTQEDPFALAGSGAIREHGLTDRPTQDVDLFTINVTEARFTDAVGHAMAALSEHGYDALLTRSASLFARLIVTKGDEQLGVDLGVDWRGHDPVSDIDCSRGVIGSCTTSCPGSATTCGRPSSTGPATAPILPATTDPRTEESRSSPMANPRNGPDE